VFAPGISGRVIATPIRSERERSRLRQPDWTKPNTGRDAEERNDPVGNSFYRYLIRKQKSMAIMAGYYADDAETMTNSARRPTYAALKVRRPEARAGSVASLVYEQWRGSIEISGQYYGNAEVGLAVACFQLCDNAESNTTALMLRMSASEILPTGRHGNIHLPPGRNIQLEALTRANSEKVDRLFRSEFAPTY
jgi:hypothetical protein